MPKEQSLSKCGKKSKKTKETLSSKRLQSLARTMILTGSSKIITVDMSYRDTGVAISTLTPGSVVINEIISLKNPPLAGGFSGLEKAAISFEDNTIDPIRKLILINNLEVVVIEMPAWSQSAVAAMCIGVCWGGLNSLKIQKTVIEPNVLKDWSGSKRGDAKRIVKQKVLERITLTKSQEANDNIVDAIGLSFVVSDTITRERYINETN